MNELTVTELPLYQVEGELRIHDLDLAKRLGFERPVKIRELIARNAEKLKQFSILPTVGKIHEGAGRPTQEYYLNQKQAVFVCMKSETDRAFDVQADIVRVYDAHLKGQAQQLPDFNDPIAMARAWADSRERELLAEAKSRALVQQLETEQPYIELAHSITGSSTMYVRDWIALMKEDHNVTLKEKAVREFLHEQGYWYWTQTPPRETRAYSTYDHLFKLEAELINGYPRQVLKITGDGVLVLTPIVIAHFDTKRLKSKSKT